MHKRNFTPAFSLIALLIICGLLIGCAAAPSPVAPIPFEQGNENPSPGESARNTPEKNPPVTETPPFKITAPQLNKASLDSVIQSLIYAVDNGDVEVMSSICADEVDYTTSIEGGDLQPKERFLDDYSLRASNRPYCNGIMTVTPETFIVFFSPWSPVWEVKTFCYPECSTFDPPRTSDTAGFIIRNIDGEYQLKHMYFNRIDILEDIHIGSMRPCPGSDAKHQESVSSGGTQGDSCPNAPEQQVKVSGRAAICTKVDSVALRSGPAKTTSLVKRLLPGAEFDVTGGPVCADNSSWWKIKTANGITGWISEGGDVEDPYYICPIQ